MASVAPPSAPVSASTMTTTTRTTTASPTSSLNGRSVAGRRHDSVVGGPPKISSEPLCQPRVANADVSPGPVERDVVLNKATRSSPGAKQQQQQQQQLQQQQPPHKIWAKRKNDSLTASLCEAIVQHQLGLSINLILLLTLTHVLFPSLRPHTNHFFVLSYHVPETGLYNQGWDDLKLVSLWIIVFTALRAATMDYVLLPLARRAGVHKKKASVRFAEQAWLLIYYTVFWGLGMYLMSERDYLFDLSKMWTDWPQRSMTGLFKWYYLAQFAFWLQQILVVNIEERRKDHWQMFSHHIITCALMFFSYGFYMTKVGHMILCLMDVVDLLLPTAKILKYAGYQTLCDLTFVAFIVTWALARHVLYLAVCWSIYVDVPIRIPYGCYDVNTMERVSADAGSLVLRNIMHGYRHRAEDDTICMNAKIHSGFLGLLLALQVITILWFGMICRVAYRVVMGQGADDSRSDDEGDAEDEDVEFSSVKMPGPAVKLPPREEEVGVEELSFAKRRSTGNIRRKAGRSSGISIPGTASDHKELLGRIGCDKPTSGGGGAGASSPSSS